MNMMLSTPHHVVLTRWCYRAIATSASTAGLAIRKSISLLFGVYHQLSLASLADLDSSLVEYYSKSAMLSECEGEGRPGA